MILNNKCYLIVLLTLALIGCSSVSSSVQSNDQRYLAAQRIPPLRIPPGISSSAFEDDYPIAARNYPGQREKVNIVPPGL